MRNIDPRDPHEPGIPDLPDPQLPPPPLPAPPPSPGPQVRSGSGAGVAEVEPRFPSLREPVPPPVVERPEPAPTTVPGSFATPAIPSSMTPFRTPDFSAGRLVGAALPRAAGAEDDDEVRAYLAWMARRRP